jgi:hypothetical protein
MGSPMPHFTKQQMFVELQEILLLQADHIRRCSNQEIADQFIGFHPISDYSSEDPARVDLKRFHITEYFEDAYDFAFDPSILYSYYIGDMAGLLLFMNGIPRIEPRKDYDFLSNVSPGHTRYMTPEGYCQTTADAAFARWKLEAEPGFDFTPRDLALLANMSEGAVRNAMSGKTGDRLQPIPGSKPIRVEHAEAVRWLSGRRGFVPRVKDFSEDHAVQTFLEKGGTPEEFARLVRTFFSKNYGTSIGYYRDAEAMLGWTSDEVRAWESGSFTFDAEKASELAKCMGLDVPKFVGRALEISLRRDAKTLTGETP